MRARLSVSTPSPPYSTHPHVLSKNGDTAISIAFERHDYDMVARIIPYIDLYKQPTLVLPVTIIPLKRIRSVSSVLQ